MSERRWSLEANVTMVFLASRLAAFSLGVRFDDTSLGKIQHYLDPELLRSDLLASVLRLHSQPPLYNLFLGGILAALPDCSRIAFAATSMLAGLVLALVMARLAVRLGASARIALFSTTAFAIGPASLLYENYLFYSLPTAMLLAVAALFLHRYAQNGRVADGFAFFSALTAVVLTRSLFLPVWLAFGLGVALVPPGRRRRTMLVSALPILLALSLFAKNAALFGLLGSSSWYGMSAARMTVFRIPKADRLSLVAEGRLSEISRIRPFSPPETYFPVVGQPPATGHAALDAVRISTGAINYNHAVYPAVSRRYAEDALRALRIRPGAYAGALADSFWIFLQPPSDFAPFALNRQRIATWERVYDFAVYGQTYTYDSYPTLRRESPIGHALAMLAAVPWLYLVIFVAALVGPSRWAFGQLRTRGTDQAAAITILFLAGNVVWVMLVGNLAEVGENNRFRFLVEPAVFVLATFEVSRRLGWRMAPVGTRKSSPCGSPGRAR